MISLQIKPWVAFGFPYLLIELFYIGIPVVRTDGRTVTWLPNFLAQVDYHISLAMGLRPRARFARGWSSAIKYIFYVQNYAWQISWRQEIIWYQKIYIYMFLFSFLFTVCILKIPNMYSSVICKLVINDTDDILMSFWKALRTAMYI